MYTIASLRRLAQSAVATTNKVTLRLKTQNVHLASNFAWTEVTQARLASTSSWRFGAKDILDRPARMEREPDLITASLQKAGSPEKALQLIGQHCSVMNNSQILSAFFTLHDLVDQKGCHPRDISFSQDFKTLCGRVLKRIRFFDVTDAISLLKVSVRLELPASSPLIQGICQLIRSNLNHMTLSQLTFIDFLLSQQKTKSVFTDALRMAIPLVFQAQCPSQLDTSDLNSSLKHFYFAVSRRLDSTTIATLSKALLPHATRLTADQSVNVVLTACFDHNNFRSIEPLSELVETCLHSVASNVSSLPDRTIRAILSAGSKGLFSKPLYDALWSLAIQQQWPLWQLSMMVESCIQHEYIKPRDLRYLREVIAQNQTALQSDSRLSIFTLSRAFAVLPISADDVAPTRATAQLLASTEDKIAQMKANPVLYLGFIHALTQMGVYPKNHLEVIMSPEFFDQLQLKVGLRSRERCLRQLLEIERTVHSQLKSNSGWDKLSLDERVREMAHVSLIKLAVSFPPLIRTIQSAFGGSQFIKTQTFSPSGMLMDVCVVMRQGEYPMAISPAEQSGQSIEASTPCNLKDLEIPSESKVIGIVITDRYSYLRNTGQMKRHLANQLEGLAADGICPVTLDVNKWKALLEHERLPFIMRSVKEAVQQGEIYQSGGSKVRTESTSETASQTKPETPCVNEDNSTRHETDADQHSNKV